MTEIGPVQLVSLGFDPGANFEGRIVDELEPEGATIAQVSKRWFRVRDTYGIELAPCQQDILVLAVSVAVDPMAGGRK